MGSKRVPNPGKPTSFPCTIQERMEFRVATIHFRPIEIRVVEREREKKERIPSRFPSPSLKLRSRYDYSVRSLRFRISPLFLAWGRKNFPTKKEREREIDK